MRSLIGPSSVLRILLLLLAGTLAGAGCGDPQVGNDTTRADRDAGPDPDTGPRPDSGPDGITDGATPDADGGTVDLGPVTLGVAPECNPLGTLDTCMLPYPSSVYLEADAATSTGYRVALPQDAMPSAATGGPVLVGPYNRHDGFSPATPIVAYLAGEDGESLDITALPAHEDPGISLTAASATVLYDMDRGERVAHFAEIDAQGAPTERHVLYIWPLQRLLPDTRYAVGVTRAVRTVTGGQAVRPAGFGAIADGREVTDSPRLEAARPAIEEVIKTLGGEGVKAADLLLAWDFRTSSEERLSGQLIAMRDVGLAAITPEALGGPAFAITNVIDNPNASTLRVIEGTYKAPLFLTNGGLPGSVLARDEDDRPALQGTWDVPFIAVLPVTAATTALPLFQVGHGIFGSADQITQAALVSFADDLGFAMIASDLIGVADGDEGLLAAGIQDLNKLPQVTERMQQSHINQMALARVITTGLMQDAAFRVNKQATLTGVLRYVGVSVGGIMGGGFMAYCQDIVKGVLGVPGGPWSLMIPRSLVGNAFRPLLASAYREPLERQLLLALVQNHFDPADPISGAPYLIKDPLPETPAKQILMAMSIGDALVPNLASFYMARSIGLPMLLPSPVEAYGFDAQEAPLDSALAVYTINPADVPPRTDTSLKDDNNAHVGIFLVPRLWEQLTTFLAEDGQVTHTCNGPCDPQ